MAKRVHFFMLAFLIGTLADVKADSTAQQETVQTQETQTHSSFDDDFAKELEELSLDLTEEKHEPSWPAVQAVKDAFTAVGIKVLLGFVAVKEYFTASSE